MLLYLVIDLCLIDADRLFRWSVG